MAMFLTPSNGQAFLIDEWADVMSESARKIETETGPPAKLWTERFSGMEFIWVEGGCFKMGSPPHAVGRDSDEEPVHKACVSSFWMGKYEVTQGQWRTIMRGNPSKFRNVDTHPVEKIGIVDAKALAERLSKQHEGHAKFRLPTEAEWEFVCRERGLRKVYPGSQQLETTSWFKENSLGSTQIVGTLAPNSLGFYDMGGNVWEWVSDSYDRFGYRKHKENNPVNMSQSDSFVIRGGSWREHSSAIRCANRGFNKFSRKRSDVGVRLVVLIEEQYVEEPVLEDINTIPF
ncbi:MAG: formylglycine-generating enzyme family protein [Magnetococcales bacterium]|nr:formylglycine-generating enzyme family protein [Magnetococcales bacterium]